jgi:hypothetical protein
MIQSQPTGYYNSNPNAMSGGGGGGNNPAMMNNSQFLSSFMPAPNSNVLPNSYMDPSTISFASSSLPQGQAQYQQQQQEVKIPWALTSEEKKKYDQIFRAWDIEGTGFIGGAVSKEVFGQAGLETDDLMEIW